ncbi:MAG: pro-sigmaK processing inhibitor BofA family protein [Oscillospiraceae bacterium]|nr:pro-sigmaK processing inhibitor BofA family protein [Oscillospiraceae bacterium]
MTAASTVYLSLLISGIILLVLYSRSGKLLKCVTFTAVTGFAALFLVTVSSGFTGIQIELTPFSAIASGILGIPGVLGLLLLNII